MEKHENGGYCYSGTKHLTTKQGKRSATKREVSISMTSTTMTDAKKSVSDRLSAKGDVPWYRSCRITLALVSVWGYTFFYILRIDLSMAIVCMVKDTKELTSVFDQQNRTILTENLMWESRGFTAESPASVLPRFTVANDTEALGSCNALTSSSAKSNRSRRGELAWSKELRGWVLSSFFYGYIVTQIPGGWLALRFGAKRVYGIGVLITIIATILVPVAARTHAYYLIALRVIMGLAHGVGFPATHHLYAQWYPPLERSRLASFSHAGTYTGTIIALSTSGLLCDIQFDNGWPLIFYVYGVLSFIWLLFWGFFVYDSPAEHPRIDPIEKEYITSAIGHVKHNSGDLIPWSQIFRSWPVWAIIVVHSCSNWAGYTILTSVPLYMKEVLKFDAKQNGALSALPHALSYFSALGSGAFVDLMISNKKLSLTTARKLCQCLSSAVPAVLITSMGFLDCELRYFAVGLLCLTVISNSFCRAGYMVNHIDLSPRHAGILFGISNTAATIPGMLAPMAVGFLTPNGSREEWLKVFYICSGFYTFSTIFYAVFGSGHKQPWASRGNNVVREISRL